MAIPLGVPHSVGLFNEIIGELKRTTKIPEARFAKLLMSRLVQLKKNHYRYQHMDMFLGENSTRDCLGRHALIKPTFKLKHVKVMQEGAESSDGVMYSDEGGKLVGVLSSVNQGVLRESFSHGLGDGVQSKAFGSFLDQKRIWSHPPNRTERV